MCEFGGNQCFREYICGEYSPNIRRIFSANIRRILKIFGEYSPKIFSPGQFIENVFSKFTQQYNVFHKEKLCTTNSSAQKFTNICQEEDVTLTLKYIQVSFTKFFFIKIQNTFFYTSFINYDFRFYVEIVVVIIYPCIQCIVWYGIQTGVCEDLRVPAATRVPLYPIGPNLPNTPHSLDTVHSLMHVIQPKVPV